MYWCVWLVMWTRGWVITSWYLEMKTRNKRQFLHRELLRRLLVVVTMTALDFSRAAEVLWACEPTTSQASCITPHRGMARLSSARQLCVAQWQNVSHWPANFPWPAPDHSSWLTFYTRKLSTVGQLTRPTQAFHPPGVDYYYYYY